MTLSEILTRWFDVRPGEGRKALFSFLGAYSVISFLILARALREALYLSTFDVRTLPYITIAVAVLSLPTAALFGRMMGSGNLHRAFTAFIVGFGVFIAALQMLIGIAPAVATVMFYLSTVQVASLLTSGFWMVTSEQFSIRQAKRLFGLIGAGGTLGAMITGISLSFLTSRFTTVQLALGLDVLLVMVLGCAACVLGVLYALGRVIAFGGRTLFRAVAPGRARWQRARAGAPGRSDGLTCPRPACRHTDSRDGRFCAMCGAPLAPS